MTVSSQTNKVIYIGNGVAKEFAIPFSFLEQEHLKVRQKKNDIQTERTDWTVKSGNLVFADAPESGAEIARLKAELSALDYKQFKHLRGELSADEWIAVKAEIQSRTARINELETML